MKSKIRTYVGATFIVLVLLTRFSSLIRNEADDWWPTGASCSLQRVDEMTKLNKKTRALFRTLVTRFEKYQKNIRKVSETRRLFIDEMKQLIDNVYKEISQRKFGTMEVLGFKIEEVLPHMDAIAKEKNRYYIAEEGHKFTSSPLAIAMKDAFLSDKKEYMHTVLICLLNIINGVMFNSGERECIFMDKLDLCLRDKACYMENDEEPRNTHYRWYKHTKCKEYFPVGPSRTFRKEMRRCSKRYSGLANKLNKMVKTRYILAKEVIGEVLESLLHIIIEVPTKEDLSLQDFLYHDMYTVLLFHFIKEYHEALVKAQRKFGPNSKFVVPEKKLYPKYHAIMEFSKSFAEQYYPLFYVYYTLTQVDLTLFLFKLVGYKNSSYFSYIAVDNYELNPESALSPVSRRFLLLIRYLSHKTGIFLMPLPFVIVEQSQYRYSLFAKMRPLLEYCHVFDFESEVLYLLQRTDPHLNNILYITPEKDAKRITTPLKMPTGITKQEEETLTEEYINKYYIEPSEEKWKEALAKEGILLEKRKKQESLPPGSDPRATYRKDVRTGAYDCVIV